MKKIYAFEVREDEEEYFRALAERYGVEIVLSPELLTEDKIPALDVGSAVTVLGMNHYGEAAFRQLAGREIRGLSTRTIGYNHIDLEAARRYGVHVCSARYAPNGVADYTVMMILLCLRNYKQSLWRTQVNDFSLNGLLGREVKDLTVGVIGTGSIGCAVVRDLSGFGCRILAYSRHVNPAIAGLAEYVPLEELYRRSDVITLHLPLTPESYHFINDESIAQMKRGVVLINCARGGLTDIDSLIRGVETEQIGALGIDCLENEEDVVHRNRLTDIIKNPSMVYLRQFKNVVHTQHMAFYTDAAVKSMVECGVSGLLAMERGEPCATQLV